jgi:hypothetical protein
VKLALLLCALAPSALQDALAPTLRGEARVESRSAAVEVGEPFALELTVHHEAGDVPQIDASALESDPTWAVLGGGELATLPDPQAEGTAVTRASWELVSLEPGERELPAPAIRWSSGDAADESIEAARGTLEVRAVLGADEDAPRPIGDFLGLAPEQEAGARTALLLGIGAALALGAIAFAIHLRRQRASAAAAPPSALERLAALEEAPLEQPEAVVEAHVELARALREAIDARLGASPAGLTDQEWVRSVAARLGPGAAQACAELLAACEPVKYGAERPTHWAARERIARARELATAAAGAQQTAEARA